MAVNWKIKRAQLMVDQQKLAGAPAPVIVPVDQPVELVDKIGDIDLTYARLGGGNVSVGPGSGVILGHNPGRVVATIVNDSANTVYITFGPTATANTGIRLNANGGSVVFGLATDIPYLGVVSGIASGASTLVVAEV